MLKRITTLPSIKNNYFINNVTPHIVNFKLYDITTHKEINYGFLFVFDLDSIPEDIKNIIYIQGYEYVYANYAFMHFSFSFSLTSSDGEYRYRLIRWQDIQHIKKDFQDIWDEVSQYVSLLRETKNWSLYTNHFSPKLGEFTSYNTDLDQIIKTELYPITFLSATWFLTMYNEMYNLTENHMNEDFKDLFLSDFKTHKKFMTELIKKFTEKRVELFNGYLSRNYQPLLLKDKYRTISMGFKMIPLNLIEVHNPFNIRYKPWREYFVSNRASDLVINQVTPGLPIFGAYYYIKNSKRALYDNPTQYEKLKNSELSKDILNRLYEAQRGTYFISSGKGVIKGSKKTTEYVKKWINTKFKKLNEKINEPISYTMEELLMSDITLLYNIEHVGRTVADTFYLAPKNKLLDDNLGNFLTANGYIHFAKYMFDICYTLLSLNKRLGLIHGDLHLNNATIGFLYQKPADNTHVLYYLNKEDSPFAFPNNSYFGCVIDFSRSIIDPDRYENFKDITLPSSHKFFDREKTVIYDMNGLLNLYIILFPGKAKQKDELQILFRKHFSAVFKLLTCIDLYMFSIRLLKLMDQMTVYKRAKELVEDLNKLAEKYITSEINFLLDEPIKYEAKILEDNYPMENIVNKCFGEFKEEKHLKTVKEVSDCYCLDMELKYETNGNLPDGLNNIKYKLNGKLIEEKEISAKRQAAAKARVQIAKENYDIISIVGKKYKESSDLELGIHEFPEDID
jgi:ribosomal protein S17E